MKVKWILLILLAGLYYSPIHAQDIANDNVGFEMGFHANRLLPNQVDGVSEIMAQWGLQTAFGMGPGSFVEFTTAAGKGDGASWQTVSGSLRMDMTVETLTGLVFIGADGHMYQGLGREKKIVGGGHVGGGMQAEISEALWFRVDMKFNVNPGTSLTIRGGFVFRFGAGGGEA